MGYSPIASGPPPTRESFHLGRARAAYVEGDITIEQFEAMVEHVLAGGTLPQALGPNDSPFPAPRMERVKC